jgi:hypothetical protein
VWIAAAVVVPVAVIAVIGVVAWIWRRKRSQQNQTQQYGGVQNYDMLFTGTEYPEHQDPAIVLGPGIQHDHSINRRSELHG